MFRHLTTLAMIPILGVFGLLSIAHARSMPKAPATTTSHMAGHANGSSLKKPLPIGWNFVHATNCDMYTDPFGTVYLYVYPIEGGFFFTYQSPFQALIEPACQTGNWLAFHVIDNNGDWDQVYTYSFK